MVISGRQQTRFGKLHSANLNFAWGTYLSPNAFLLRKASLVLRPPRRSSPLPYGAPGLPLAPWVLLLWWVVSVD